VKCSRDRTYSGQLLFLRSSQHPTDWFDSATRRQQFSFSPVNDGLTVRRIDVARHRKTDCNFSPKFSGGGSTHVKETRRFPFSSSHQETFGLSANRCRAHGKSLNFTLNSDCQKFANFGKRKDREAIAEKLSQAAFSWGCSSQSDSTCRVIFTADAYARDRRRFTVLADERLSAFLEPERVTGVALGEKRS
jgi:hypothetical protein